MFVSYPFMEGDVYFARCSKPRLPPLADVVNGTLPTKSQLLLEVDGKEERQGVSALASDWVQPQCRKGLHILPTDVTLPTAVEIAFCI